MAKPGLGLIVVCILLYLTSFSGWSQVTAESLLEGLGGQMDQIERFEADATVFIDVEFIDIKERKVKIRFQQPDQFTFDAEGLALLPKNGLQMEYLSLLQQTYTALLIGEEEINGVTTHQLKVIPEADDSDIILAQLWIQPDTYQLYRMKTFTRKAGSYVIDFAYGEPDMPLPKKLTVTFEINNLIFPSKSMSDIMSQGIQQPDSLPKEARVIVEYNNYQIEYKK